MRSKKRRVMLTTCMLCLLCIQLIACGKNSDEGTETGSKNDGQQKRETFYTAQEISLPEFDYISAECVFNHTLYIIGVFGDEKEMTLDSAIYSLDPLTGGQEHTKLPIVFDAKESVQNMAIDGEGSFYVITAPILSEDAQLDEQELYIKKFDEEGNLLLEIEISEKFKGAEYVYATGFAVDEEGHIFFSNPNDELFVLDGDGALLFQTRVDGSILGISNSNSDKMVVNYYGSEGIEIRGIDLAARGMGKKYEAAVSGYFSVSEGIEEDLLITSDSAAYGYDLATGELMPKFEWNALDIVIDFGASLLSLGEGNMLFTNTVYTDTDAKREYFVIKEAEEGQITNADKMIITFGEIAMFGDSSIRAAIADFNRSNDECRIEIVAYGESDWNEGIIQLNADIVNGKGPDILSLPLRFSMGLYAQKGVLEDLYPYIDEDNELSRDDFIPNILKAYERDEHLYGLPVFFSLYSLYGKTSVLGNESGWDMDDLIAFADQHSDSGIFDDASKSGALTMCRYANGSALVDWSNGDAPLNQELLLKMLEFANRFMEDEKYQYDDDLRKKIEEGELLLLNSNISNVLSHQMSYALFGEPVSYVGYPVESGNGTLVSSTATMAINAGSQYKDKAWEFLRTLYLKEFHHTSHLGEFSVRQDGLEKQFTDAMKAEYVTDAHGNKTEIEKSTAMMGSGENAIHIKLYSAKEEEVEELRELIYGVENIRSTDTDINDIISEEAQYYFSGAKSVQEVMDIINSRVRIYVNENR